VSKVRTTLTIDEEVLRHVKIRAAREGVSDSAVIEASVRRELGMDLFERLWKRNDLPDDEAMKLALEAQHRTRPRSD
jgi:hypothetical protein